MEMTMSMEARLMRMEEKMDTLTGNVDGLADVVVARVLRALDATERAPMVLTTRQLQAAVRAAMDGNSKTNGSENGKRKRPVREEARGGEEGEEDEAVGVVTPPTVAKNKPLKVEETTATQRVELDLTMPGSFSLSTLDAAIYPQAQVAPFTPVPAPKKPSLPKQPAKQPQFPANTAVRRPVTVAPPTPPSTATTLTRPASKPVPLRPHIVTPPPPPTLQRPPRPAPPSAQATPVVSGRLYLWGNAWHNLPEDYEFPKISLELMWRKWCCGDSELRCLPLRDVQASDVTSTNNRKRLSDLKYIMKFIEQRLQEQGVWKESPSEIEADQMLIAVRGELFPDMVTKSGLKRGAEGLKWHSAVTLLRTAHKKARTE